MIDVRRYQRPTLGSNDISYPFGSPTKEGMATEIRRFADDVESGKILVQKIQCAEVLDISDYTMSCLFVELRRGDRADSNGGAPAGRTPTARE